MGCNIDFRSSKSILDEKLYDYNPTDSRTLPRPKDTDLCSACKHPFGDHYTSYNRKQYGCSHVSTSSDQRDGYSSYKCITCKDGFQITYRYL